MVLINIYIISLVNYNTKYLSEQEEFLLSLILKNFSKICATD